MTPAKHQPKGPPARAGRAGVVILVIVVLMLVGIFAFRQLFHAEVQQQDPASSQAPDGADATEAQAPAK